ncbi:MAG TPA: sucrose-6-phosphate hydrolase [Candidatus Salinicoccus stercoripullorum]|uniref:Sucrose-6-phosphate hydrolase n=1 Tax=Candidatus Salinicoccus stercoripullorum TaxID=2838756 RepID=A0A9D1QGB5_9STAP|nr:sucrose-6-phosphate hydrolase [Candidatus Salinicoccus stercoripullorum]
MVQYMNYRKSIDEAVYDNRNKVENDRHRLRYHLMPPAGLLNDPNGLIHFKGAYHVFFQWNPFETRHGSKSWGHYVSKNLTDWTLEEAALVPDEWYDKDGCYSGSAVEHEGKMYLFYTGNVKNEQNERSTYQCLAVSDDGMDFEKKGPVLKLPDGYTPHFRDPKVWDEGSRWLMILGARNVSGEGEAVLAQSYDMKNWEFLGPAAGSNINGLGDFGYMWECPDLFRLDGEDVLVVCPQGLEAEGDRYQNLYQAGYFTGSFDAEKGSFEHGAFDELDRGFDFYAPQTMLDDSGRRIMIGWMGMTDDREQSHPTIASNWIHALTLPRMLEVKAGKILQKPVPELEVLRGTKTAYELNLQPSEIFTETVSPASEVVVNFDKTLKNGFEMEIRKDVRIVFEDGKFIVGRNTFDKAGREQRTVELDRLEGLQIYLDHSSVEIFVNAGEEVFTCRFFPDANDNEIRLMHSNTHTVNFSHWPLDTGE